MPETPRPPSDGSAKSTSSSHRFANLARSYTQKALTGARGFISHAAIASKMRVRRIQLQRNIDAAKFELTERVYRDAGMQILAHHLMVPGEEALHQSIKSQQAMCEMLDRAVVSGDSKRKRELAKMSKELTDLQESLGERALDAGFSFPQADSFHERRKKLVDEVSSLEKERAELDDQIAVECGHRKLSYRITMAGLVLILLIGIVFVGAAMFRPAGHFKGVGADDRLERGLGLVVCGLQVHETQGDKQEIEAAMSTGSAFAISRDGYLLTNRHVVEQTQHFLKNPLAVRQIEQQYRIEAEPAVWIIINGKKLPAKIAYVSEKFDLAILKVNARFRRIFRISGASHAVRGTDVWAAGFPGVARLALSDEEDQIKQIAEYDADTLEEYFQPRDLEFVLTRGTVSRTVHEAGDRWWVQHNADINHGNSGGPLIRRDGVVVGMNTLGFTEAGASGTFYALELGQARDEIERITKNAIWN